MLLYPEVQKKAQAELDTVIGKSRLPTIEDRAQLGYVDRILKETLRWGPIGPIGRHKNHALVRPCRFTEFLTKPSRPTHLF